MKRSIWADDYQKLRHALKKIRKDADLTQGELAKMLDKPRTYVTKYENADRNLDYLEVIKVCIACKADSVLFLKQILQTTNLKKLSKQIN